MLLQRVVTSILSVETQDQDPIKQPTKRIFAVNQTIKTSAELAIKQKKLLATQNFITY